MTLRIPRSFLFVYGALVGERRHVVQIPFAHGGIPTYRLNPVTDEPVLPLLPPVVENSIRIAFKGNRDAWLAMLKEEEQFGFGHYGVPDTPHPRVLEVLAEMMGIKLPAMPVWKAPATEGAKEKPEAKT